jgi:hypothetical protein
LVVVGLLALVQVVVVRKELTQYLQQSLQLAVAMVEAQAQEPSQVDLVEAVVEVNQAQAQVVQEQHHQYKDLMAVLDLVLVEIIHQAEVAVVVQLAVLQQIILLVAVMVVLV